MNGDTELHSRVTDRKYAETAADNRKRALPDCTNGDTELHPRVTDRKYAEMAADNCIQEIYINPLYKCLEIGRGCGIMVIK